MNLTQILSKADPNRRKKSSGYAPRLVRWEEKLAEFIWNVSGSSGIHTQRVQISPVGWRLIQPLFKDVVDEDEALEKFKEVGKNADIKLSCDCPDFLYGGFAYIAHKLGYGLISETRPPNVRNRTLKGTVCKHLLAVLDEMRG